MKNIRILIIVLAALLLGINRTPAQDKQAQIELNFSKEDTLNICKATVTSEGQPVAEVSVKLGIKRLFGLLPAGETTTDESGVASFELPNDVPGDSKGNLVIVAKIEDDENYENTEVQKEINWGAIKKEKENDKMMRALWASRENAPFYFIIASNLIILGIWGTIIYVVLQVFKIKRISSVNKKV